MNLLEINDLHIGYGKKALSSNISLTLQSGQFVGLIGQNGVGKSTLIRTSCGLQEALSGSILLQGRALSTYSKKEIAKMLSLVLTDKPESMQLTVIELIALGRYPYSGWLGILNQQDKLKIDEAISQMEINYIANKKLFELSDGQLQKAMIARALAQDTEVIILDEPTSHLDLKNKIDVLALLRKIADQGKSILISTHEVGLAAKYCDQFWCMDFQKALLSGTPANLIKEGKVQAYLHIAKNLL